MTTDELKTLKERARACLITGSHLANAEQHIVNLVDEVMKLRASHQQGSLKMSDTVTHTMDVDLATAVKAEESKPKKAVKRTPRKKTGPKNSN